MKTEKQLREIIRALDEENRALRSILNEVPDPLPERLVHQGWLPGRLKRSFGEEGQCAVEFGRPIDIEYISIQTGHDLAQLPHLVTRIEIDGASLPGFDHKRAFGLYRVRVERATRLVARVLFQSTLPWSIDVCGTASRLSW